VWIFDREQSHWQRLTRQAPEWIAPSLQPTLERLRSSDGVDLTGWLYRPPGASAPGPAVIHLHGGPEAQERPTFNPLFQELAAREIAVFAPNVRGSSGFGYTFVNADNLEKRFGAIADVAACAEYLFDRGIAERGRLACAGRSYGGYLTLASLVFHPELFVAGVDVCGLVDFNTFYANTEPWIAVAAYSKYGHPERDAELLRRLSPIHRFDALRAPLLVVHGETDFNVPLEEAEQVVSAARARGVPVEYLLFRDEGHELLRVRNKQVFVERTVQWLAAWLSGGELSRDEVLAQATPPRIGAPAAPGTSPARV
jgi:dipeptidyl aminopeptidase/acylaminoacyl peptidase